MFYFNVELFKAFLFSSTSLHALLQMCLTLCSLMDCSPPRSSAHGILRARILEFPALLQGIFLIQGQNTHFFCLLHWQVGSLPLGPPGKPSAELFIAVFMKYIITHNTHEVHYSTVFKKSIITHKHTYLHDHFSLSLQ